MENNKENIEKRQPHLTKLKERKQIRSGLLFICSISRCMIFFFMMNNISIKPGIFSPSPQTLIFPI